MGIMDDMKDKFGDDEQRLKELREKHNNGELDDKGREELQKLEDRFRHKDNQ